ncbi:nuclear transport factor 2 family protein [Streptomyces sp. B6B3]|uniref:nuclear transport factor 2 family protein n=1 Tax=Streptomyces sp. B6B3 TaxID=3153570 RepID=UPI00325ECFE6
METPKTTRDTVMDLLSRIGTGDTDRIAELFAETVDWRLDWPESEHGRAGSPTPWIRHRTTRSEAAANFREIAEHHVPESVDTQVERILVDDTDAVVLGEIRQTARPTGRAYTAWFALHVTVEDGRITRFHIYEDSLSVAQAFTPAD